MSNTIACSLGSSTANISACTDAGAALAPLLVDETGYSAGNPPQYYSQPRVGCTFPNMQQTGQSPNDPPQVGAKSTATSNHPSTP